MAVKEEKTIDAVVQKLDEFIKDGNITEAEKEQASELVKKYGAALTQTSTFEKYQALLNQK
jgi:deoxyribose-phosphate aldolase